MNCTDCKYHKVIPDPDPHDWFNDDDVAVVCTIDKNDRLDESSNRLVLQQEHRIITTACRPYHIKKECETPSWCRLYSDGVFRPKDS
jgi:hypothetical protein